MKFQEIENIKKIRSLYIMLQRIDKKKARFFQRSNTKSQGLHCIAKRDLNHRREKLRLIEIILRQHNQLKKLYGGKR